MSHRTSPPPCLQAVRQGRRRERTEGGGAVGEARASQPPSASVAVPP